MWCRVFVACFASFFAMRSASFSVRCRLLGDSLFLVEYAFIRVIFCGVFQCRVSLAFCSFFLAVVQLINGGFQHGCFLLGYFCWLVVAGFCFLCKAF